MRAPADQRVLLATTIRHVAHWRKGKADEFGDDALARKRSLRAKQALKTLANFVEALPDDDPDLNLYALRRTDEREGRLLVTFDSLSLLSRFGMNRGAWQAARPTESQMRSALRRIDGIEGASRSQVAR